jgi:hypothetical protein
MHFTFHLTGEKFENMEIVCYLLYRKLLEGNMNKARIEQAGGGSLLLPT